MCVTFLIPNAIVYPSIELSSKLKASASPSTHTSDLLSLRPIQDSKGSLSSHIQRTKYRGIKEDTNLMHKQASDVSPLSAARCFPTFNMLGLMSHTYI